MSDNKPFTFAHLNPFGRRAKAEDKGPAEDGKDKSPPEEGKDTPDDTPEEGKDKPDDKATAPGGGPVGEAAVRADERRRCAAIFAAPAAAGRIEMACHLAFNTDLPAAQACALLEVAPAAAAAGNPTALAAMDAHPNPQVGGADDGTAQTDDQKAAAAVLASMAAVGLIPRTKESA